MPENDLAKFIQVLLTVLGVLITLKCTADLVLTDIGNESLTITDLRQFLLVFSEDGVLTQNSGYGVQDILYQSISFLLRVNLCNKDLVQESQQLLIPRISGHIVQIHQTIQIPVVKSGGSQPTIAFCDVQEFLFGKTEGYIKNSSVLPNCVPVFLYKNASFLFPCLSVPLQIVLCLLVSLSEMREVLLLIIRICPALYSCEGLLKLRDVGLLTLPKSVNAVEISPAFHPFKGFLHILKDPFAIGSAPDRIVDDIHQDLIHTPVFSPLVFFSVIINVSNEFHILLCSPAVILRLLYKSCEGIIINDLLSRFYLTFLPLDGRILFPCFRTGLKESIPVVRIDGLLIKLIKAAGDLVP